jgi:hypothetical protein
MIEESFKMVYKVVDFPGRWLWMGRRGVDGGSSPLTAFYFARTGLGRAVFFVPQAESVMKITYGFIYRYEIFEWLSSASLPDAHPLLHGIMRMAYGHHGHGLAFHTLCCGPEPIR